MLAPFLLLAAASSAPATERLPVEPAARACPRHGPGFVEVPGTRTCIRISGRVRSEYGASSRRISRDDISGFSTTGRVAVDSRTDTAYGPVRTYVRLKAGQVSAQRP